MIKISISAMQDTVDPISLGLALTPASISNSSSDHNLPSTSYVGSSSSGIIGKVQAQSDHGDEVNSDAKKMRKRCYYGDEVKDTKRRQKEEK